MEISEKVAYLKGLAEGLALDTETKEGKLIAAIIDVLDEMSIRFEDIDDGRPIANMNIEGMPWYVEEKPEYQSGSEKPPMDKRETRAFIANALLAALAIGLVFIIAAALFLLFCTKVWFQ